MPRPRTITEATRIKIVARANKGETFRSIATWAGISHERVRQIIQEDDPDFVSPRAPHLRTKAVKEPRELLCDGLCEVCEGIVCYPRTSYCSPDCAEAAKIWRRITDPLLHHQAVAKWTLRESDDPVQRRWAARVLNKGTTKRWLLRGSRTYELLEKTGLLEKLPEEIEIRGEAG